MLKKMGFQGWNAYAKKSMDSLAASVVELRKNPNAAKILTLKIVMLSFLITAATTITILSQRRLAKAEYRLFVSRFHSVSDNAIISVSESLSHVNLNIREMSVTFGHVFPDAAQWPNVAWKGFQPTAAILSNISAVGGMGILPIVLPEQVPAYQDFISAYYDTDPYCDRATYMNPYYPNGEIWDTFDSSEFPPLFTADPFGNTTDSPYQILTPISQYTFSSIVGPHGVGFNLHSEPALTRTIDLVINCTKELNYPCASSYCGTVSPAIPVPYPSAEDTHPTATDMVAVFLHPIFPADNQSALVGFAAGTFSWKALLTNVIPKDVSDIDCVIEVDGKVFTFCIQDGIPYFKGEGSRQESAYTYMRRRSAILGQHITVSTGEPYIVNFYPTRAFEQQYETNRPERGALVLFCSFAFCTILFGSYDLLLRREFDRNQAVLDTKRRFVRFISHEIRTPLNTVRLGMKLLEVEIGKLVSTLSSTPAASLAPLVLKTLETWKQLADEIVESSESAVEVLNDLLNYDKIEIGALKLELSYMNVRELVDRTVAAMQVQAQQKGITLELHCPCPKTAVMLFGVPDPDLEVGGYDDADDEDEVEDRTVVGDTARMGQVLRNLISNALKFTPSDGQVSISGTLRSQSIDCDGAVALIYLVYMISPQLSLRMR
jgi:signal transduction histidine kinase